MFPTGSCCEHLLPDGSELWSDMEVLQKCELDGGSRELRQVFEDYNSGFFLFPSPLPSA